MPMMTWMTESYKSFVQHAGDALVLNIKLAADTLQGVTCRIAHYMMQQHSMHGIAPEHGRSYNGGVVDRRQHLILYTNKST